MPCEETNCRWWVVAGHYTGVSIFTSHPYKGGKMKTYNYDSIIHLLLNKYGWIRVPWFVSLQEKPDGR